MTDTKTFNALTAVMRSHTHPAPAGWRRVKLATLSRVEEFLDRLENAGSAHRRVAIRGDGFVVRWRWGA
jgi:hypothetical protein